MDENQIKQAYSDPTQQEAISVVNKRDGSDKSTSGEGSSIASEVGNASAEISLQTKTSSAKNDDKGNCVVLYM